MTDQERALAKKQAERFLRPMEPVVHLPKGVYEKNRRFNANIKLPSGKWGMATFDTAQEAAAARNESLNRP